MTKRHIALICLTLVPTIIVARLVNQEWAYLYMSLALLCASRHFWIAAAMLILAVGVPLALLPATAHYLPRTYDAELWRLDSVLGLNLQPHAMKVLYGSPVLARVAGSVYGAYLPAMTFAALIGGRTEQFFARVAITTAIGAAFYAVVPACGPYYYLTSMATAPRNCMPSLHTTWALTVRYQLRRQHLAVRLGADLFLLMTLIATVGFGLHYVVDLIAAVPFWAAMEWLTGKLLKHRMKPDVKDALELNPANREQRGVAWNT